MKRNFNIDEILTSVDVIVTNNKNKPHNKNKVISRYKRFDNKNIGISDNLVTEKIIIDAEKSLKNNSNKIKQKPLILNKEYIEKKKILEDNNLIEDFIEEGNDLKELENNYIYKNELLKSENTRQEEIVKDLSVLLDNFKKQKIYSGLYEKIKLYQEDNAMLRKKILNLSNLEKNLRLQLAVLTQNKNINKS